MEHPGTILEQRRTAFRKEQTSAIEFGQVGDEGYRRMALALCETLHLGDQRVIG